MLSCFLLIIFWLPGLLDFSGQLGKNQDFRIVHKQGALHSHNIKYSFIDQFEVTTSTKRDNNDMWRIEDIEGCETSLQREKDLKAKQLVVQEFCVGPIWSNTEAKEKADKWIAKNKPNEGWKFTGSWHSSGGTSYCKFKKANK